MHSEEMRRRYPVELQSDSISSEGNRKCQGFQEWEEGMCLSSVVSEGGMGSEEVRAIGWAREFGFYHPCPRSTGRLYSKASHLPLREQKFAA